MSLTACEVSPAGPGPGPPGDRGHLPLTAGQALQASKKVASPSRCRAAGRAAATAGLAGSLQIRDLVLHGRSDLLQPVAQLHLLGRAVLLQSGDDLKGSDRPSGDCLPVCLYGRLQQPPQTPGHTSGYAHYFPCDRGASPAGGRLSSHWVWRISEAQHLVLMVTNTQLPGEHRCHSPRLPRWLPGNPLEALIQPSWLPHQQATRRDPVACRPVLVRLTGGETETDQTGPPQREPWNGRSSPAVPLPPPRQASTTRRKCLDSHWVSPWLKQAHSRPGPQGGSLSPNSSGHTLMPGKHLAGPFQQTPSRLTGGCSDLEAQPRNPPERRLYCDLTHLWPRDWTLLSGSPAGPTPTPTGRPCTAHCHPWTQVES